MRKDETEHYEQKGLPVAVCFELVVASECNQGTQANGIGKKYLCSGI